MMHLCMFQDAAGEQNRRHLLAIHNSDVTIRDIELVQDSTDYTRQGLKINFGR